tara:strand:- start:304 stop:525 length:222 start_codon:yes stop_codon:yes gene_type:complete
MKISTERLKQIIKEELRLDDVPGYSTPIFEGISQVMENVMYLANELLETGDEINYEKMIKIRDDLAKLRKISI